MASVFDRARDLYKQFETKVVPINQAAQKFLPYLISGTTRMPLPLAQYVVPKIQKDFAEPYLKNQVVQPVIQGVKTVFDSNQTPVNRALGGLQAGMGAFSTTPAGIVFNAGFGGTAGALRSIRTGQPLIPSVQQGITQPTSLGAEGLGIQNPFIAAGVDFVSGNPKAILKSPGLAQRLLKPAGLSKTATTLVDNELKGLMARLEDQLASYDVKKQLANQNRELFSKNTISIFNKIKQLARGRKVQEGDIETLRARNPQLIQTALEAVMELNPNIQDDQSALDFILSFPTKTTIKRSPEISILENKIRNLKNISESGVFPANDSVNVVPTQKTLKNIFTRNVGALEDTLTKEWKQAVYHQAGGIRTTGKAVKDVVSAVKANSRSSLSNAEELKDISGFYGGWRDVYRNFKAVYGKKFDRAKQLVLDPFDQAKGNFVTEQEQLANELDATIVKKLGIGKGSKESAAVQEFGEGLRNYGSLVKQFGEKKAVNIVEADKWFRAKYDQLLDDVNRVRSAIYPNNPEKIIPKRQDYYRHFKEMQQGFGGLMNIFETPAGISSSLSGKSEFAKPKSKFLSFAQKRLGMQTDVDAVGGFIDYIRASAYAKHIDPQIGKFRALADELAANTTEGPSAGKINNFVEYLQDFANDLSGKTNPADRTVQKWIPGGRKIFKVINWANSRVKANIILGNMSSTIAQAFNIPQGIASAGPINATKGMGRSLAGMFNPNNPTKQSVFLNERYFKVYDKFDTGILNNTKKFAVWMTQALDEVGTKYIWNSHYEKALSGGISNPVKYADDMTRSLVAGRGIGEVPLIQKSKLFQLAAPFQLEVANLWHVMGDMVGQKQFGKLATLFMMNYLFNRGAEQIRGSAVTFDPIQATIDALGEMEEGKSLEAGGRLTGEVLSNLPFGQTVAAAYPEYGFKVGDNQFPTRKELFGRSDPTRFGSGLLATQAITDPLYKLLPPFGGGQAKKTVEGLSAYNKGYSETSSGRVRYPIDQDPINLIRSALFGQYATPEARNYFKNQTAPLGDKQSQSFKSIEKGESQKQFYDNVQSSRKTDSIFSEDLREYDAIDDQIKTFVQAGDKESAIQLIKDNEDLLLKGKVTKEFQKRYNKYYTDLNKVQTTPNLPPEVRGKLLDAIQLKIKQLDQGYAKFKAEN